MKSNSISKYLLLLFLSYVFISCENNEKSKNVALLLNQYKNEAFRYPEMKTWRPNQSEVNLSEKLIRKFIQNDKSNDFNNNLNDSIFNYYYFQLVPYINKDNEKIIYVNALCENFIKSPLPWQTTRDEKDWEKSFYDVLDGGSCFWQLKININTKTTFNYSMNGI